MSNFDKHDSLPGVSQPFAAAGSNSWTNFLQRHRDTLWACDFFSVKAATTRGLRERHGLVFLCLETRATVVSSATEHPHSAWGVKQAEQSVDPTATGKTRPDILTHDGDTKFTQELAAKLKYHGMRTNPLPKTSPHLKGRGERANQTIKYECLARFLIFGQTHLDFLLCEFPEYDNTVRSHISRDHFPLK